LENYASCQAKTAMPLFWLSTLVGLGAYAVFGVSPLGLTLAYRTLNFLCIPLIILSAFGLERLYKARGGSRRAAKAAAIIALIAVAALNSYNMYASVSLREHGVLLALQAAGILRSCVG